MKALGNKKDREGEVTVKMLTGPHGYRKSTAASVTSETKTARKMYITYMKR